MDGPGNPRPVVVFHRIPAVFSVFRILRSLRPGAVLLMAVWAHPGWAQGELPGKAKSRSCAACHGPQGLSTLLNAPNLAGQPEVYLSEQLKAYRSGKRSHEVMGVIAKPLSDNDIADLAAWYASITIEIKEAR